MRLDAKNFRGQVIDLDTGQLVRKVIWVDLDTGTLKAYRVDAAGQIARDSEGNYLWYVARGRFKIDAVWVHGRRQKATMGAPKCARCPCRMTLPGDDLCPVCRAREQGRRVRVEPHVNILEPRACDAGCGRAAVYSVMDEVLVTPDEAPGAFGDRTLYGRSMMVNRRWYCKHCYEPPRIVDARGEVIRVDEEAGGVRPS